MSKERRGGTVFRRRTRRAALVVFLALAALAPWRLPLSSDGLLSFRSGAAVAFDGTFRLPPPGPGARLDSWFFRPYAGGDGVVAVYGPLGSLWRAAALVIARAFPAPAAGRAADLLLSLVPIFLSALTVLPVSRLLVFGGVPPPRAPFLAAALILTTFLGPLGVQDFNEPLLVLLSACALERALAGRRMRGEKRAACFAASGAFLSLALLVKPTPAMLLPALLVPLFFRRERGVVRPLAAFALGFLPGAALLLALNAVRFGSPFELGYAPRFTEAGYERVGLLWTIARLSILPNRGLVFFAPLLLLAFVGLRSKLRAGVRTPDRLASLLAAGAFFGTNALWWAWEGGMGSGPRLCAPVVALLAPWLAPPPPGEGPRRLARGLAIALAAAGLLVNGPIYLIHHERLYQDVASRPGSPPPLGPVVGIHRNPSAPAGIHPLQRLHYVPSSAPWLVAPGVLLRVLRGEPAGIRPGGPVPHDAALLHALIGLPIFDRDTDTGRLLLEEAQVTAPVEPERAARFALHSIRFGGPPLDARSIGSWALIRTGRFEDAARLCREGLLLDPTRRDLAGNLAYALEAGRRSRPPG